MALGSLIPYRRFEIETELTPKEIAEALRDDVHEGDIAFSWPRDVKKAFIGRVWEEGFELRRVIRGRNSFLPLVRGRVAQAEWGARVRVTMAPHLFVFIFMGLWLSGVGLGCLVTLTVMVGQGFEAPLMIPYAMLVFGLLLPGLASRREASRAEGFLRGKIPQREAPPPDVGPYR